VSAIQQRGREVPRRRLAAALTTGAVVAGLLYRIWIFIPTPVLRGDGLVRYDPLARNLWLGRGFSNDIAPPFRPNVFDVPGYPAFVAALYAVSGGALRAVVLAQFTLELLTLLAVAATAHALGWGRCAAVAAFALGMVCPFVASLARQVASEVLAVFLTSVFCLSIAMIAQRRGRGDLPLWMTAGFVGSLLILVRVDAYVVLAFLVPTVAWTTRTAGIRGLLIRVLAFSATVILVLLPWEVRDHRLTGSWRLPGLEQYTGSHFAKGYRYWLDTWVDDVRWLEVYVWPPLAQTSSSYPPEKVPDVAERERAGQAFRLAQSQGTLDGEPQRVFLELADEARRRRWLDTRVLVGLRRTFSSWLKAPSNAVFPGVEREPWARAAYAIWIAILGIATWGMWRLLRDRATGALFLPMLIVARSVMPFSSAWGLEVRYLYEALPAVLLLAAHGLVEARARPDPENARDGYHGGPSARGSRHR
jgi:hypothetical protein